MAGSGFRRFIRPLFALPVPGRWRIFDHYINRPEAWSGSGVEWTRSKIHGLQIPCDLNTFSGRSAWYFHRWYELDVQSLIKTLLPRGATFVDVGGNVGMASLTAAATAGAQGQVIAFEPNPAVADIFASAIERNALGQISLHRAALSDSAGTATLFVPARNHGEATLSREPADTSGKEVVVDLVDASSLGDVRRLDLVKIDVEGHELVALKTLAPILTRFMPPVICELMDEHLVRAGTSSAEVVAHMAKLGYRTLNIQESSEGRRWTRAVLSEATTSWTGNVLFVAEADVQPLLEREMVAVRK